jgi:hypothetical protein
MSGLLGRHVLTNFTHGYGPFLRTAECAISIARLLSKHTGVKHHVVVPWVYRDAQQRILTEEFGKDEDSVALVLDPVLGDIYRSVILGATTFAESLLVWLDHRAEAEAALEEALAGTRVAETLDGRRVYIEPCSAALVVSRTARLRVPSVPAYSVGFGHASNMLREALAEPNLVETLHRGIFERAVHAFREVESSHRINFTADPASTSVWSSVYGGPSLEVASPPSIRLPLAAPTIMLNRPSLYASVSGVDGRSAMLQSARDFGLEVFTNAPDRVPGGIYATPGILRSPQIMFQYARPGWGAIWTSVLAGVPLVMPSLDQHDDPEMVFNTRWVERTGIGLVYRGQNVDSVLERVDQLRPMVLRERERVARRFGTLDGVGFVAERIAADWISEHSR